MQQASHGFPLLPPSAESNPYPQIPCFLFTSDCLSCMCALSIEGAIVGSQGRNDGVKLCACKLVDL